MGVGRVGDPRAASQRAQGRGAVLRLDHVVPVGAQGGRDERADVAIVVGDEHAWSTPRHGAGESAWAPFGSAAFTRANACASATYTAAISTRSSFCAASSNS